MSRPHRTRIILVDGGVYLLRWHGDDIDQVQRLHGAERDLALDILDDAHAEIEGHLIP